MDAPVHPNESSGCIQIFYITFSQILVLQNPAPVDGCRYYIQLFATGFLGLVRVFFMPMDLLQQSFLPARTYQAVTPNDILRSIDCRHVQRQRHLGERGGYSQRLYCMILARNFWVFRVQKSQQKQRTVKKPREEKHETKRKKGEDQKREKNKKTQSTLKNRTEKNKERKKERSEKNRPEKQRNK